MKFSYSDYSKILYFIIPVHYKKSKEVLRMLIICLKESCRLICFKLAIKRQNKKKNKKKKTSKTCQVQNKIRLARWKFILTLNQIKLSHFFCHLLFCLFIASNCLTKHNLVVTFFEFMPNIYLSDQLLLQQFFSLNISDLTSSEHYIEHLH